MKWKHKQHNIQCKPATTLEVTQGLGRAVERTSHYKVNHPLGLRLAVCLAFCANAIQMEHIIAESGRIVVIWT